MKKHNALVSVGLVGLGIQLVLNLLGLFVFHKAAAVFFTDEWWSSWFPALLVWIVFIIAGIGIRLTSKPSQ
jgi:hypothetical protein